MKKTLSIFLAVIMLLSLASCALSSAADSTSSSTAYYEMCTTEEVTEDLASVESELDLSNRKLIYTVNITAETKDFDASKIFIDELVSSSGAYVESSSIYGSGDDYYGSSSSRSLSYTVRVPAEKLDEFTEKLSENLNITYNYKYMQDVTDSYVDAEARLNSYEQEEERLLELLDEADTLDEIILLEDKLYEVRYQIESLTATIKQYDSEISYSTVNIDLRDVAEYSEPESFGSEIGEAFIGGWTGFVSFIQDAIILVVRNVPFILVAAVIVLIVVIAVKSSNKKKKARFAAAVQNVDRPENKPKEEK